MNVRTEGEADKDQGLEVIQEDIEETRKYPLCIYYSSRDRYRDRSGSRPDRRRYRSRSRDHRRRDDSKSRDMKEGRCFGCGQRGHIKRDCPE